MAEGAFHGTTTGLMKSSLVYWRAAGFDKRAKGQLIDTLKRLRLYCQAPDPRVKGSTDLDEAMKQFTIWPERELLKQIEGSVITLVSTERDKPQTPRWKAFKLLDARMPKLRLIDHINKLAGHAQRRLLDAGWPKLEEISCDKHAPGEKGRDTQNLLRDISD